MIPGHLNQSHVREQEKVFLIDRRPLSITMRSLSGPGLGLDYFLGVYTYLLQCHFKEADILYADHTTLRW